ncbi:DUF262 domain-containing protein [Helicobacter saguini]|uniref:DUF262 domain-containing protein n=2 Tax=Helicobacter saguini TaxID=1548018 RepID=A0A347VU78_9HELI|nr:DUF262 domain-containing protein [Helicobacter saguini]MWV66694.1 DUF262 domain-containing protein [Helicobacter saguini]MWV69044.1 DUF262 domain-containing protein [Helicobacter saguini]MWV71402.1 DUF262 domain-containing protein [Helicobacter saguini]TLD94049.1 DUF262 domain-containing protein [Helicobacter saguini]
MNLKMLLKEYEIEIPRLQRDYAQGRISQVDLANSFLDSIFQALESKNKKLHIDFIYGYEEDSKFILIDGQQRVTTLWLLHFYLYRFANRLDEILELLQRFSYSTRDSSANFCENLLNEEFGLDKEPSKSIIDMGSTFELEENLRSDPTIKAMLNMLDLIYKRIKNKDSNKLIDNLENITFDIFDMKSFGLGEELYIKMNARGKQLSDYENLKAFMEKNINIKKNNQLLVDIDTKWSDYFFDSKNKSAKENAKMFDTRGKNFLHYANLFFKLESNEKIENMKTQIESINHNVNEYYAPLQNIENLKWLDRVIEFFLLFNNYKTDINLNLRDSSFFDFILNYKNICYFFSILSYLQYREINSIDSKNLNDYLRVSRHFIENHLLDDANSHIPKFVELFKQLSKENDVYKFLSENPTYAFHKNIYELESRKAKLILKSRENNDKYEEILNKTSDNPYLIGWIDFLLDFSDFEFEYKKYNSKKNKEKYENPNLEKFTQYANLTMQIIDFCKEKENDKNNLSLFHRSFLSIGNYGFYATNFFYGNNFSSTIFRDREAYNWIFSGVKNKTRLPYFKSLLDKLLESKKDSIKDKLQEVINNVDLESREWWEQLLIKQKELFKFLNHNGNTFQRYSRIRFNEKVELLPKTKSIKDVRDVLDFGFYCYCKNKGFNVEPKEYESPEEQRGNLYLPLKSHFTLNNKQVICNSMESYIEIEEKKLPINLKKGNNIFDEFDRILKEVL